MKANIHEAKTHLSKLLARVAEGQEVTITNAGRPVAKLVPLSVDEGPRLLGEDRGAVKIANDFDGPLPADVLKLFEP